MANLKIGIIGSGIVAQTLGAGFLKYGHPVQMGTRDASKLSEWITGAGKGATVASVAETAAGADIVVLAVKGSAALEALKAAGEGNLKGKTVIDTTNPIADLAPENGVLRFYTDLNQSQMETLQAAFPEANFVKAFSCVGSAFMVNPSFESKPSMFICGNNDAAKLEVDRILTQFGWETADFGQVQSARAIEPLCMLWCVPGLTKNQWAHAFKLLKL